MVTADSPDAPTALAADARRYDSLFSRHRDPAAVMDPEGRFVMANPAWESALGYPPRDLLGESFFDVISSEERPRMRVFLQQALRGVPQHDEAALCHHRGRRVEVSFSLMPLPGDDGRPEGVFGIFKDLAARRALAAEQRLLEPGTRAGDADPLTGLLNHRAFHARLEAEADRAIQDGSALAVVLFDLDNFRFFNDAYGHSVGDDVLHRVADVLRTCCRDSDHLARFGGDEFSLLIPRVERPCYVPFLKRLKGCLASLTYQPPGYDSPIPVTLSLGCALLPDEAGTPLDALDLASRRLARLKSGDADMADEAEQYRWQASRSVTGFSMLDALVAAVDNKDRYTRRHSEDVLSYCLLLAGALGMGPGERRALATAALLHDVGKIGVPDSVLRKPGRLTEEEYAAVRQHPQMGAVIVGAVPGLEGTLDAVRHHHERWDGGGYPFGLSGEETPLPARAMAVADAFSAMTTDRPYRKGMPAAKALSILREGAGTQWDPRCVHAFQQAWEGQMQKKTPSVTTGPKGETR